MTPAAHGSERWVVLGLARPRSPWFRTVAGWATSAAIPVEFVKCVSAEELRARLASGRPYSAALVDGGLPALDRDLLDRAAAAGAAVLVVDDGRPAHDWRALGAAAVLPADFDRRALLTALADGARPLPRADTVPGDSPQAAPLLRWRGAFAMVCGPGGTGASSVAVALAQGLAADGRAGQAVVLADFALHAEQAMLHGAADVVPGVQDLVEAHRTGRPTVDDLRGLTCAVPARGYRLVLGLRRARAWASLRPRAVEAAVDSLRTAFRVVVADCDADLEGEQEGGSADVEDRHVLARTAARHADVVFAVGRPGMKGVHSLARVAHDLRSFGVARERIVAVVVGAPRGPRARADLAAALGCTPVFLPLRRVDEALRDGAPLPAALTAPLVAAFHAVNDSAGPARGSSDPQPVPVAAGSLTQWSEG